MEYSFPLTEACMHAQLTLWDPMDCSPPGSSVHGIFQARILGWIVVPNSGDLPNPGTEPVFLVPDWQADSLLPGSLD